LKPYEEIVAGLADFSSDSRGKYLFGVGAFLFQVAKFLEHGFAEQWYAGGGQQFRRAALHCRG
jgi:hypothetical protein